MEKMILIPDGVEYAQKLSRLLDGATVGLGSAACGPEYDYAQKLLNLFVEATEEVLVVSIDTLVQHQMSIIMKKNPNLLGEVTGLMKLSGGPPGMAAVSMNKDLGKKMSARLADASPTDLNDQDILDGVGEIINQISGRARTSLAMNGQAMTIDLPVCLIGAQQQFMSDDETFCLAAVFECLDHFFSIQLCLPVKTTVANKV